MMEIEKCIFAEKTVENTKRTEPLPDCLSVCFSDFVTTSGRLRLQTNSRLGN